MVPAPGTEVVQCHCGEKVSRREGGIMTGRRRQGEAVPSVERGGIQGWGVCSQEPEEGLGKQGLCQFCRFTAHDQGDSPSVPGCLPPCCVEPTGLGYANSGVIQPGRIWGSPGKMQNHFSSKGPRSQRGPAATLDLSFEGNVPHKDISLGNYMTIIGASLMAQTVKNLPIMQGTQVQSLGREDPLEKGMATHSSILAWRIPWTEEPDGLQSMRSQRLGLNWEANTALHFMTITVVGWS